MINHSRPTIGLEERRTVDKVLRSGQLTQGPEVARFERQAARFLGLRGAVAVNSGTKAIELSLKALGARPGKEILIPSYVCSALWLAASRTGADPVLVDCEEGGFQMSMADAKRRRNRRTCALIVPHLFGEPADIKGALSLGVPVIEDCAQSLGARSQNKMLGSFGAASVLSFYGTKLLTTGEGGMVVSSNAKLLEKIRQWREYDEKKPSEEMENAKMTDIQAALGGVQLKRLPEFIQARAQGARAYDSGLCTISQVLVPAKRRVYFRYVIRVKGKNLDRLTRSIERSGVCARRPVFRPLHWDVPCRGAFPNAECAWREALSLPLYPGLKEGDQKRVVAALKGALNH